MSDPYRTGAAKMLGLAPEEVTKEQRNNFKEAFTFACYAFKNSSETGIWEWRAWSAGRKRICDSGTAFANDEGRAEVIASMCLGGPYAQEVVEFEVTRVAVGTAIKRPL